MNIYITETSILLLEQPPDEEHALIGPYNETTLYDTIASFPDLFHPCKVYTFIHVETKAIHNVVNLQAFQKEIGSTKVKHIIANPFTTTKKYLHVPGHFNPLEHLKIYNERKKLKKSKYNSLKLRNLFT